MDQTPNLFGDLFKPEELVYEEFGDLE